ncbi:hypothetical protein [Pseudomonas taiwanensis]|uniref:hypothetical protein n=1 Tax=Pseudomonas taiwanensis TaxID=470150 RepID=UPI001648C625|nr:hypothetical protein [Pseudomonas taiwanensis]MBC3489499.1 hypothetical protein [Pseudomonas taiwanensis]
MQKLFVLPVNLYRDDSQLTREYCRRILNVCYGFAGSTLIGTSVKDILALCLDNLAELNFYDGEGEVSRNLGERMPSIEEIARLAQKIAQKYLLAMGQCHPKNARCEIIIFGFCKKLNDTRAFVLKNTPEEPALVGFEEMDVSGGEYLVLGDKKEEVLKEAERKRSACAEERYWKGRAPILALQQIIKNSSLSSIGGYAQICMATSFASRTMYIADVASHKFPLLGFDVFTELGALGGFSISLNPSLVIDERLID